MFSKNKTTKYIYISIFMYMLNSINVIANSYMVKTYGKNIFNVSLLIRTVFVTTLGISLILMAHKDKSVNLIKPNIKQVVIVALFSSLFFRVINSISLSYGSVGIISITEQLLAPTSLIISTIIYRDKVNKPIKSLIVFFIAITVMFIDVGVTSKNGIALIAGLFAFSSGAFGDIYIKQESINTGVHKGLLLFCGSFLGTIILNIGNIPKLPLYSPQLVRLDIILIIIVTTMVQITMIITSTKLMEKISIYSRNLCRFSTLVTCVLADVILFKTLPTWGIVLGAILLAIASLVQEKSEIEINSLAEQQPTEPCNTMG